MGKWWIVFPVVVSILILGIVIPDSEALKSSGNPMLQTNSKMICGDHICDRPMTIQEKIMMYLFGEEPQTTTERPMFSFGGILPTFCNDMTIDELINSGQYNVIDKRTETSPQNLDGTGGADLYLASNHGDTFDGQSGDDCIIGGSGDDNLRGRAGNDYIVGGPGRDEFNGDSGNNDVCVTDSEDDPSQIRNCDDVLTEQPPSGASGGITITTRDPSYLFGDSIRVEGSVSGVSGGQVEINIIDPDGGIIATQSKSVRSDGTFDQSINTDSSWVMSGTYSVEVTYDTLSAQTTFSFTASQPSGGSSGSAEITIYTKEVNYEYRDSINYDGEVKGVNNNVDVSITILDPNGIIVVKEVKRSSGSGSIRGLIDTGSSWGLSGQYKIKAEYESKSAESTFDFVGSGKITPNTSGEIVFSTDNASYDSSFDSITANGAFPACERYCDITIDVFKLAQKIFSTQTNSNNGGNFYVEFPIADDWKTGNYKIIASAIRDRDFYPFEGQVQTTFYYERSDRDQDGIFDRQDNCPDVANQDQANFDGDSMGDACDPDDDNDRLRDSIELSIGTNPFNGDSDGDGLGDYLEASTPFDLDPLSDDSDGDGIKDGDEDSDGDGLTNILEVKTHRTNPNLPDTDLDGLNDGDEVNIYPTDPLKTDSDKDGLNDGDEINKHHTNPLISDTDGGGSNDGLEVITDSTNPLNPSDDLAGDNDGDGLTNGQEKSLGTDPYNQDTDSDNLIDPIDKNYANPLIRDTDGDKLIDGDEYHLYKTNAKLSDTDSDGLSDFDEVYTYQTNPLVYDMDNDGYSDGYEVQHSSSPTVYNANSCSPQTIQQNPQGCSLAYLDLSERMLTGLDFSGRDLRYVNFRGSTLTDVILTGADLSYANLENTNIYRTNLNEATLVKTKINGMNYECDSPFTRTAPSNSPYSIDISNPHGGTSTATRLSILVAGPYNTFEYERIHNQKAIGYELLGTVRKATCFAEPIEIPIYKSNEPSGTKIGIKTGFGGTGGLGTRYMDMAGSLSPLGGPVFVEYKYPFGSSTYTLTDKISMNQLQTIPTPADSKYGGDLELSLGKTDILINKLPNWLSFANYALYYVLGDPKGIPSQGDYIAITLYDDYENENEFDLFLADVFGFVFDVVAGIATAGVYTVGTQIVGLGDAIDVVDVQSSSGGGYISDSIKDSIKGKQLVNGYLYSETYLVAHPVIFVEDSDGRFYTYGISVNEITDVRGDKLVVVYYNKDKWITAGIQLMN